MPFAFETIFASQTEVFAVKLRVVGDVEEAELELLAFFLLFVLQSLVLRMHDVVDVALILLVGIDGVLNIPSGFCHVCLKLAVLA